MSLLKQLLISVTVAVCIILVGTLWLGLNGAKSFLNERLQADAQNAASSLALTLSQPANQDPVTQELLMTALFDSGQFRSISLTAPNGEVRLQLDRGLDANASSVPSWFDAWLPLKASTVTRAISDGWKQSGEVAITPLDATARQTLWRMAYQVLVLILAAGLFWAVFAVFLIRWLRRALQFEISERVRAIEGVEAAPGNARGEPRRIKELAHVRTVIDSVRERVRATADEQNRQIETLHVELNSDDVTGMANRKFFINELRRRLESRESNGDASLSAYGHVLIFRQRDLVAINALHERSQTDAWLRTVADGVRRVLAASRDPNRPEPQLARLNGSDFVVLLAGYDGPDTTDLIQALRQTLDALRIQTADARLCRWSYALTDFVPGSDVAQVLARLDHGLMRAENAGHDEVEYMAASEYKSMGSGTNTGESAWKGLIQQALRENSLTLSTREVRYRGDDARDRHEGGLMLHMPDDNSTVSGYLFMPPAVRLGLSAACDLRALELGLQWVRENHGTLAVRASLASLLLPDFLPDMEQVLSAAKATGADVQRLTVEIDAHGFVAYPEEVDAFCALAHKYGLGVGVRRLAEQPAALLRLHKVVIRYIKLGGELISDLLESPGATQLIAAITEAAIGQGVKVYAHDVPNAATATMLLEYGVLLPWDTKFPTQVQEEEGAFVDN